MDLVVDTASRVERHTPRRINERNRRAATARARRATPAEARRRLAELDREWDIERAIECNASCIALAGVLLGAFVHRGFLVLPAAVTAFLLQHALQGWCPPVPVLRRLGFRTQEEIQDERCRLEARLGR